MHGTFFVCVCAVMLACSNAFIHPFVLEDLPLTRMPSPNASRRFHLPAVKSHSDPEEPGMPWRFLKGTPVHSRIAQNEINTRRVESMLVDFFSALLHADDCTLLERHAQGMGAVYLDVGFNVSRPPFLLRHGVRDIMGKYNLPLRPVEHKWNVACSNESEIDV